MKQPTSRYHDPCGQVTERRADGTCIPCQMERQRQRNQNRPDKTGVYWCKQCDSESQHDRFGACIPCIHRRAKERDITVLSFHKKCGQMTLRDRWGACISCRQVHDAARNKEALKTPRFCKTCGETTPRYTDGRCTPCQRRWLNARPDFSGTFRWCNSCEKETERDKRGKCRPCSRKQSRRFREDNPELSKERVTASIAKDPEKNKQRVLRGVHRRRARRLGNGFEIYSDADVFERDNWTCHLCTTSIDPKISRMDPLGAVTDHIIPISKGGSDTFDNVAAAHRQCNNKRGTQLLEEMNLPMDPPVKRESQRKRMTTNGVVNK